MFREARTTQATRRARWLVSATIVVGSIPASYAQQAADFERAAGADSALRLGAGRAHGDGDARHAEPVRRN